MDFDDNNRDADGFFSSSAKPKSAAAPDFYTAPANPSSSSSSGAWPAL